MRRGRCLTWPCAPDENAEQNPAAAVVRAHLTEHEIEFRESGEGVFSFSLPGERKLQTAVRLDVGKHALGVHAFVCRAPDENHEGVYRWLLERNLRMYAVSFALDRLGDIYLDARLPLAAVTSDELDRLLGRGAHLFRRVVQHDPRARLRLLHPQGVGVAHSCAGSRPPTSRRSAAGWSAVPTRQLAQLATRTATRARVAGSACTRRIRRLTVAAPYAPGHDHTQEEEHLDVGQVGHQAPHQACGQEPVVEALVGRERLGRLGELGVRAERRPPLRLGPQEHLEHQDVDVDQGHEGDQHGRDDVHGVSIAR